MISTVQRGGFVQVSVSEGKSQHFICWWVVWLGFKSMLFCKKLWINKVWYRRAAGTFKWSTDNKQLLDEVFVISRIIKVEVRVISRSGRLRLITITETLIILDVTKTESSCFIIHWTQKHGRHVSASLLTAGSTNRVDLTRVPLEITFCGHTWHDNPWLWVSLTW